MVSDVLQVLTHRESKKSLGSKRDDAQQLESDVSGTYAAMLILKALATFARSMDKVCRSM